MQLIKAAASVVLFGVLLFLLINNDELICAAAEEQKERGVFAAFPSFVTVDSTKQTVEKFCIRFVNLEKFKKNISVDIDVDPGSQQIIDKISDKLFPSTTHKCFQLKIKPLNKIFTRRVEISLLVKVDGERRPLFKYFGSKFFYLLSMPDLLFLETDKAIYRPKETGNSIY
jgi:hypothetical protein